MKSNIKEFIVMWAIAVVILSGVVLCAIGFAWITLTASPAVTVAVIVVIFGGILAASIVEW